VSHDLSITRTIPAPRAVVWRCWTEPSLLKQWYCPKPWQVTKAEIDVRPGGRGDVTMQGPNGEVQECPGVYLEVVPQQRLTFTDAMTEGFMPGPGKPFMIGHVTLRDTPDGGTEMVWGVRHWSAEDKEKHETMGFHEGWSAAAEQLDELARQVAAKTIKAA
jgi:uncharacterized protein YndB with AHSA1/START domain